MKNLIAVLLLVLVVLGGVFTPLGAGQVSATPLGPQHWDYDGCGLSPFTWGYQTNSYWAYGNVWAGQVNIRPGGPTTLKKGMFLNFHLCEQDVGKTLAITVLRVMKYSNGSWTLTSPRGDTPEVYYSRVGAAYPDETFFLNQPYPVNATKLEPISYVWGYESPMGVSVRIEYPGDYVLFLGRSPLDNRPAPAWAEFQMWLY